MLKKLTLNLNKALLIFLLVFFVILVNWNMVVDKLSHKLYSEYYTRSSLWRSYNSVPDNTDILIYGIGTNHLDYEVINK